MEEFQLLKQKVEHLENILGEFVKAGKYVFPRKIELANNVDIVLYGGQESGDGTKIGTTSTQKLGFWGATPVARPTAPPTRTQALINGTGDDIDLNANFSSLNSWADDIEQALLDSGLVG